MKKVTLTIWARVNELGMCELAEDEDEDDPSSYPFENYLIGIVPDQEVEGIARVNGKEIETYGSFCVVEYLRSHCKH